MPQFITFAFPCNDDAKVYLDGVLQNSLMSYVSAHRRVCTKAMHEKNVGFVNKLGNASIQERQAHA